jgi:hypothetical protein
MVEGLEAHLLQEKTEAYQEGIKLLQSDEVKHLATGLAAVGVYAGGVKLFSKVAHLPIFKKLPAGKLHRDGRELRVVDLQTATSEGQIVYEVTHLPNRPLKVFRYFLHCYGALKKRSQNTSISRIPTHIPL